MWVLFVLLSTFGWALVNVLDSVLVHNYEKRPMTLMWCQSMWSLPILAVLAFFLPLHASWPWLPVLLLMGIVGYLADLQFFHVLEKIDVSVTNVAWSLLSLILAIAGFILFQESWGPMQAAGAVLILAGVFFVSLYHQHINLRHTLWLLFTLATLYAPVYIIKKAAINENIAPATVFFWMLVCREGAAFLAPWFFPSARRAGWKAIRNDGSFSRINAVVIVAFLLAEYFGALAYQAGELSLVAIVSDIQPFVVMGIAWLIGLAWPHRLPKELLTKQSVRLKILCFTVVTVGLALLALGQ